MYGEGEPSLPQPAPFDFIKEVRSTLDKTNTINFENCFKALRICAIRLDKSEQLDFVNTYLMRIIGILLNESPARLGTPICRIVDDTLGYCLTILMTLKPTPPYFVDGIVALFNKSCIYYSGQKGYSWNNSAGMPQTRLSLINKFASQSGFEILYEIITSPNFKWPGCEIYLSIASALVELPLPFLQQNNKTEIVENVMTFILQQILALSEDHLKKESQENLSLIFGFACTFYRARKDSKKLQRFYVCWKDYTLKLFHSTSLVLKLSAWDQVNDLIREAMLTRPPAKSYRVFNAGASEVNGIYELLRQDKDGIDNPWYQKQPSSPTEPVFTLFRCVMRNKAKHWFISVVDKLKPGSSEDIDYYTHKSLLEEEREPQLSGWHKCGAKGVDPCPLLERVGYLLPPGESEADLLVESLPQWISKADVLTSIFGPSIHRELVARSTRLIKFMAEIKALTSAHVLLLWKAVLANEGEVLDELLSLVAAVSMVLQEDLYAYLVTLVQEPLNDGGSDASAITKSITFLEKCQKEYFAKLSSFPDTSASKLLTLVRKVYTSAHFDLVKNQGAIQELLSQCLNTRSGVKMASSYISTCLNELSLNNESTDEVLISKLVNTLNFLLTKHGSQDLMSVPNYSSFPDVLYREIKRFLAHNRGKLQMVEKEAESFFNEELSRRLHLLRQHYSLSIGSRVSIEGLVALFDLCSGPVEFEEFFRFLKSLSFRASLGGEIVCDASQTEDIFRVIICSPSLTWEHCGDTSVDCFQSFFFAVCSRQNAGARRQHTPLSALGLSTLWRMVQNVSTSTAAEAATDMLIRTYNEFESNRAVILNDIFKCLEQDVVLAESQQPQQPLLLPNQLLHLERLVDLIILCLVQREGLSLPPHATCGTMHRIQISVSHRRVSQYYNYNSAVDSKSDKPSEGKLILEVHPFHTVYTLKKKVATVLDFSNLKKLSLEFNGRALVDNHQFLAQLGVSDGSELLAVLMVSTFIHSLEDDDVEEQRCPEDNDVAVAIAADSDRFDLLVRALHCAQGSPYGQQAAQSLWKLLGMIPTQAKLLDQVRTMNNNLVWFTSLLESDLVRYTYALQIIDAILQPAPEYTNEDMVRFSVEFRRFFVKGGGFAATLKDFIQPPTSHILSKIGKSIGLHILRFLLLSSPSFEQSLVDEIFEEVRRNSSAITQALLSIACDAADSEDIESIQNSLMTITYLLQASEVAAQLTTNLQTKVLLLSVLRSNSHRVRDIAADFAIKMGRSQSVVFGWLTSELSSLRGEDGISPELFRSLTSLVESVDSTADVTALIDVVSSKLTLFHTLPEASSELSQDLLLGYLTLLHSLTLNFFERVMVSPFGKSLVRSIFNEFLFVISSENKETSPLCRTPSARQAAYAILGVVIRSSRSAYIDVLEEMRKLTSSAASLMKNSWGCTVAADMKKNSVEFVGLKNQGGTCYMNSLLQQMFMNVNMREAIMRTKIKSSVRSTLWHYTDAELIGQSFYFEHANGAMRLGKITDFNSNSRCHRVLYPQSALDGTAAEEVYMKVREGRFGKETGRVRHVRQGAEVGEEDEKEENARRVLEQLQRCFCFMEFSKRRYFDPKPFVDACKTLNMSFNVYHQNDSAEFYDQLLDRLETAMKGSSASRNYWGEVVLKSVFGGKTVYQKIPKECDVYVHEKQECGQGKGAREEPFLKIELMIRGHEQILDSLDELIQGELMDGDNKIMCDVCAQKKAVIRRTCFGNLPNMLVLHLKRFDLDFNTFETVKLNTRMAFSGSLNMMKYSREGFDEEEAKRLQGERRKAISPGGNESPMDIELPALDPMDYEYELSGILVHAGVAQGGHYYSFIKQPDGPKWFRFEDEDVTAFNPEAIPYQCFGGSFPANTIGGNNMHEDDRTSNALLLFYRKVHPAEVSQDIWASPSSSKIGSLAFVDGYDAFTAEVKEANEKHALMSYMLDAGLQPLMRDLVSIAAGGAGMEGLQWTPIETDVNLLNNVVELGCQFLLDVVLHFKERSGMQLWIAVLRTAFASRPSAAWNIVRGIAGKVNGCVWLGEYLFCSDALSRVTFGELLTEAIAAVAPKDPDALLKFCKRGGGDLDAIILGKSADALPAACFFILGQIITVLHDAPSRLRSHDELLIIIREFALIPSMCKAMLSMNLLEDLVYFVMPTRVSDSIRSRFRVSANARHDQVAFATVQNVFEALAALLGVPQKRKVNILDEKSSYWDPEFIPEAKAAFQTIFEELASGGTSIDGRTFLNFYEKVYGNGQRNLALIVRGIFERQDTSGDGKLTLTGFVRYHAELAVSNPKQVWKCLNHYGFHNDLTRSSMGEVSTATMPPLTRLELTSTEKIFFSDITFYESGIDFAEGSAVAIAMRVCWQDKQMSILLVKNAVARLFEVISDWVSNAFIEHIVNFLKSITTIDDGLFLPRVEVLLSSAKGVVTMMNDERRATSMYRTSSMTSPLPDKYDMVLENLMTHPQIQAYVVHMAESNENFRFARDKMSQLRPQTVLPGDVSLNDSDLTQITVRVSRAGIPEINGDYIYKDVLDDAGLFVHQTMYEGKRVTFSLYRCKMTGGSHNWFISIAPEGSKPGTKHDIDFYSSTSFYDNSSVLQLNDRLPPRGWSSCNPDYDPAPEVVAMGATGVYLDTDSGRDDSSLNVGEDENFDDSFTSAPASPSSTSNDFGETNGPSLYE